MVASVTVLAVVLLGGLTVPAVAREGVYAPPDEPGPALAVPQEQLRSSLDCRAGAVTAQRPPILLLPGTTLTPKQQFSWNYAPALRQLDWPFCTVTLPDHAMSDVQVAAEYAVFAIRTLHNRSGRDVQILGHSQGGMLPRWALRFWPDTRAMVDDVVGLAPSNHGTYVGDVVCVPGCAPAFWQQNLRSDFMRALNSYQETFTGVSYTNIYTVTADEVVQPNLTPKGSSSLHSGGGAITNVAVQDICAAHIADHIALGTYDPVGYAIALDALTHDGPAVPDRVDEGPLPGAGLNAACTKPFMPGVDPATFPADLAKTTAAIGTQVATYPHAASEPPLRCYVFAPEHPPARCRE